MSGFANTKYTDTVESMVSTMKNKISSNPNYKFSDKSPTIITYFNLNKYKSTLDEGAKITYSEINRSSGLKWNKINKMIVYGVDTMQLTYSVEDFGLQSQDIEGECVVLPGTITPYSGDFFLINHIDEKIIFEVLDVTPDTLENGANMYKLQYKSSPVKYDEDNIRSVTADIYEFIIDNVGTDYNAVLKSEVAILADNINDYIIKLQEFYKTNFYNGRVQAFTFIHCLDNNFYDPYMVEFILHNDLINNNETEFLYICHQTKLDNIFSLKYAHTIFQAIEKKDTNLKKYRCGAWGKLIMSPLTTFYNRFEDYFELTYDPVEMESLQIIPCFRQEFIEAVEPFKVNEELTIYNIIIKYLHDIEITQQDLDDLFENLDTQDNVVLFYAIPCIIYCLKHDVLKLIAKK